MQGQQGSEQKFTVTGNSKTIYFFLMFLSVDKCALLNLKVPLRLAQLGLSLTPSVSRADGS